MDLRHLRAILAIAEEGSFTAAATRLHLAQSGLSQQTKAVEEELGVRLFVRERTGVRLTAVGERAIGIARRVVHDVEELTQLNLCRTVGPVVLRVSCTAGALCQWMPAVVESMRTLRPDVQMRLVQAKPTDQIRLLRSGAIDAGLAYLPLDLTGLVRLPLYEERMVVLVRADDPLALRPEARLSHFATKPLVLPPPGNSLRRIIDAYFVRVGIQPVLSVEADNALAVCRAVRDGLGIAIVSENFPRHADMNGLAFVRLRDKRIRRRMVLVRRQGTPDTPDPIDDFIACVRRVLSTPSTVVGSVLF